MRHRAATLLNLTAVTGVHTLMASASSKHDPNPMSHQASTLAKSLAPEEVRTGDYVSILHNIFEFPALIWCDDTSIVEHDKIIQLPLFPRENTGEPLLVKAVCLPFVLVKHPCGKRSTLDVRQNRLARLDRCYAKLARKAYQSNKSKKKKRRKKRNC